MLFRFKVSQKKPVHNLACFSGLFPLELYLGFKYFQTITRCKFHNKPHAIKELIDRYVFSHISRLYRQKLTMHGQSGFIGFFDAPRLIFDHWSWFRSPLRNVPQEIIKVTQRILHKGLIVILFKLFLDIVLSSSADITRALRGCFRGGYVLF